MSVHIRPRARRPRRERPVARRHGTTLAGRGSRHDGDDEREAQAQKPVRCRGATVTWHAAIVDHLVLNHHRSGGDTVSRRSMALSRVRRTNRGR